MKYILVIGDGMADNPVPELNGRTPLQAAAIPTICPPAARRRSSLFSAVTRCAILPGVRPWRQRHPA